MTHAYQISRLDGQPACFTAGQAFAYETGDIVVRAGVAHVAPSTSDNTNIPGLDVDSNTQLGLTGTYFFAPSFGVQLLAATPFKHDITLNSLLKKAISALFQPAIPVQARNRSTTNQSLGSD